MNTGQVIFAASIATVDSGDAGPEPDIIPVSGYVDFVPSRVVTYTDELGKLLIIGTVTAGIDDQGVMRDPSGNTGVSLLSSDDPDLSHQGWSWNAYLRLNGLDPQGPYPFVLHNGETVNLGLQAPLEISNGIAILRGPRGEKGDPGPASSSAVDSVAGKTGAVTLTPADVGLANAVSIGGDLSGTPTAPTVPLRILPLYNFTNNDPLRPNTQAVVLWCTPDGDRPASNGSKAGGSYAAAEGDFGAFFS